MTVNPKRLRALPIVVLALAAVPLMAPAAANAAMGGGNAGTTTLRPDLRSANVTNVSATGVTTVRVCFNKTIASVPNAGSILVGTYRQIETGANSASRAADNQKCADAVYSTSNIDATQQTYLRVAAGAVANLANGQGNLDDSTALIGSNTHNGTRGHSTAPDLEGVTVNVGANTINYVFDQNVGGVNTAAGAFTAVSAAGVSTNNLGGAGNIAVSGNTVAVKFAAGVVGTAVRANAVLSGVGYNAAVSSLDPSGDPANTHMTAAIPGTGGVTNNPDLVSATLAADGSFVDFVYDEPIALSTFANCGRFPSQPAPCPAGSNFYDGFQVMRSDRGVVISSDTATGAPTVVNTNTVRVPLDGGFGGTGTSENEYIVWASAGAGTVVSTTGGARPSTLGGVQAGGNAGAFASGFTTGTEALRVTLDSSTGLANVVLDQRFGSFNTGFIRLVDDAGAIIPGNPISVSGGGGPAGQVTAGAQFTPGQISGARSLQLLGGAFVTTPTFLPVGNVAQIISPTAAAHLVRNKAGKVVWHRAARVKADRKLRALKRRFHRVH